MALFKRKISLPMQVVIALVLGVVVGLLLYGQENVANYIKPFGDVFLNLIKGVCTMALFKRKISLPMQVVIALVLGVVVGLLLYGQENVANYIKPFGDVFLNLIKMIVIPVVFCSLALSISNVGESKTVGRYGWKTILYFEIITTIAIGLGIIFGNLFKPGAGLDPTKLPKGDISKYQSTAHAAEQSTYGNHFIDTIVHIIPTNFLKL